MSESNRNQPKIGYKHSASNTSQWTTISRKWEQKRETFIVYQTIKQIYCIIFIFFATQPVCMKEFRFHFYVRNLKLYNKCIWRRNVRDALENSETARKKGIFAVDVEECTSQYPLFCLFPSIFFFIFSLSLSWESRYKQIERKKLNS